MDCGKLTLESPVIKSFDCNRVSASGTGTAAYLINYEDVDRAKSTLTEGKLTSIVLAADATAFKIENVDRANLGESSLNVGTYVSQFSHKATLKFLSKTDQTKEVVNELSNSRVIVIFENKDKGDSSNVGLGYECYGWFSGLKCTESTFSTDYSDNVIYSVTLESDEFSKENSLPMHFSTANDATKIMLEALVTS